MALKLNNPYFKKPGHILKGNLHTHSTVSDGSRTMQEVIDAYKAQGYDFLAFSDHDSFGDVKGIDNKGLILIEGTEISANGPHILQIGVSKPVKPDGDRQKVIDHIIKKGGFAVVNHPNWQGHFNHCPQKLLHAWQGYTGLEIYNGVIERLHGSPLATDRWDMLLSEGRRVWGFGNDDSHRPQDTGLAWNIVWARRLSRKGIIEAFTKGSFYASTGVEITDIRVHGRTLEVKTDNAQKMVVVTDGGQEVAKSEGKRIAYTLSGTVGTYIRVECIGSAGTRAWTQPFFIEGGISGTKPPNSSVYIVSRPVRITGYAADPLWKKARALGPYVSLDSAEPVKHQTLTRLLCDRKYLYAAFTCDHPDPSNLRTAAAKGNNFSLYTDDSVELFLDPANKRLDYFHILVNAAGVCGYASTKGKWACRGMKIKVTRSETAWHAEIALPLSALGVKARRNMKWGVNFCRNLSAPRHQASSWAWTGADFHRPVRFGIITFK